MCLGILHTHASICLPLPFEDLDVHPFLKYMSVLQNSKCKTYKHQLKCNIDYSARVFGIPISFSVLQSLITYIIFPCDSIFYIKDLPNENQLVL